MGKLVYRHIRNDNNTVFYVGIGNKRRPYTKNGRSDYWNKITNKHGYTIDIIAENLDLETAIELEMFLIQEYGRLDLGTGCLINMTDGGDGVNNLSEESRLKITKSNIGRKATDIAKKRMSDAQKGKKLSKEHKSKISKANKKMVFSELHRKRISEANKGRKFSKEVRDNMSKARIGKKSTRINYTHSEEIRKKMSESHKGVPLSNKHRRSLSKALKGRIVTEKTKEKIRKGQKCRKINQYNKEMCFLKEWDSIGQAQRYYANNSRNISNSLNGYTKTAYGFIWEYKHKNKI